MRYEKPEVVLLGEAEAVVLGGEPYHIVENFDSSIVGELVGYDE